MSITASVATTDLVLSFGDGLARCVDDRSPDPPGSASLLHALLGRAVSAPRPATAPPPSVGRPATAATRRAQQEWAASPAGVADLALRYARGPGGPHCTKQGAASGSAVGCLEGQEAPS